MIKTSLAWPKNAILIEKKTTIHIFWFYCKFKYINIFMGNTKTRKKVYQKNLFGLYSDNFQFELWDVWVVWDDLKLTQTNLITLYKKERQKRILNNSNNSNISDLNLTLCKNKISQMSQTSPISNWNFFMLTFFFHSGQTKCAEINLELNKN